ncbi:MAG: hypothetical protein WCZ01_04140 [Candidatus Neomarinimicrobiota bacterium]|jgi:hypothetical protein
MPNFPVLFSFAEKRTKKGNGLRTSHGGSFSPSEWNLRRKSYQVHITLVIEERVMDNYESAITALKIPFFRWDFASHPEMFLMP